MVLVYLMGLADIFAATMLVTGLKPEFILYYTIAMLAMKGVASFWGRFNPALYFLGGADLLAIVLLLSGSLWYLGSAVVLIMVAKGLISFWTIDLFRNAAVNTICAFYSIFKHVKNSELLKRSIEHKLWFGKKTEEKEIIYDLNYFYS